MTRETPDPPRLPEENEPPAAKEPIYPKGAPLRVASEDVELKFLEAEELERFRQPAGEGDPDSSTGDANPELRTPIGVRIPAFEGPLDLLLFLIRRDELDIYDIPIGHITEQYLSTLGLMRVLDLDIAGEFLVMAATLMRIKARMLLPSWPEDEDDEDPRSDLILQLLEYRRFKEAAETLKTKESEQRLRFNRLVAPVFDAEGTPVELVPISHFALLDAIKDVLSRVGEEFFYEVELEDVTLEEKIALITDELETSGRVLFVDLVSRYPRRLHVVVTFMAILELARLGRLVMAQEATFGQIWLYPGKGEPESGVPDPSRSDDEAEREEHGTA